MSKNTHMTHIEDSVIYGGVVGTRKAINILSSISKTLKGERSDFISTKWDGAPSIFAGTDPADGKFFIATKGLFNKTPKTYKSFDDIAIVEPEHLRYKLQLVFKYVSQLGIEGIVQGDLLYTPRELDIQNIEGVSHVTFHANTLVYAVPTGTHTAKRIVDSEIGVVWHTTYEGDTFETLSASYGVDISSFNKVPGLWSIEATVDSDSIVNNGDIYDYLSKAGKLFNKIESSTFKSITSIKELPTLIETYNNTLVRKGQAVGDSRGHVLSLIKWLQDRYQAEIDSKKSVKGKATWQAKLDNIMDVFTDSVKKDLSSMFDLQKIITSAKLEVINTLNKSNSVKTFVLTQDGFKETGAEGYVAIAGGDAVKLVDRMEFSYNNFSPNVIKGWEKPTRVENG